MYEFSKMHREGLGKLRVWYLDKLYVSAVDVAHIVKYNSSMPITSRCKTTKYYRMGSRDYLSFVDYEEVVKILTDKSHRVNSQELKTWILELPKQKPHTTPQQNLLPSKNDKTLPDFTNPAESARAWAKEYEEKQQALSHLEVIKQELDKVKQEYKESSDVLQQLAGLLDHPIIKSLVREKYSEQANTREEKEEVWLTPETLGQKLIPSCGIKRVNKLLEQLKLQQKANSTWIPTSKAEEVGYRKIKPHELAMKPRLYWSKNIIPILQEQHQSTPAVFS